MEIIHRQIDQYEISTDLTRLNIDVIHDYLSNQSYWAVGRSRKTVEKAIENSLNFGVYLGEQQVGFARVVSDFATMAWVCDVFVLEEHRGHGLGKALVEVVVSHPDLQNLRRLLLATRDAHDLYSKYGGFSLLKAPENWMEKLLGGL